MSCCNYFATSPQCYSENTSSSETGAAGRVWTDVPPPSECQTTLTPRLAFIPANDPCRGATVSLRPPKGQHPPAASSTAVVAPTPAR